MFSVVIHSMFNMFLLSDNSIGSTRISFCVIVPCAEIWSRKDCARISVFCFPHPYENLYKQPGLVKAGKWKSRRLRVSFRSINCRIPHHLYLLVAASFEERDIFSNNTRYSHANKWRSILQFSTVGTTKRTAASWKSLFRGHGSPIPWDSEMFKL